MKIRKLRGHHLLCVHGFQGMGYSKEFVGKMTEVVKEIKNETLEFSIQVVVGLDETCAFCPNKQDGYCNSPKADQFVVNLDTKILEHLGLKGGQVYEKRELVSLVATKIHPNDLDNLCEGCSWLEYGVCKKGIAELNFHFNERLC